ncbi:carbohydrate-binding module family 20 protein [Ramaria rubella]|nr:carbohydrate-binding module family 20 protein [Ramaria rubella]
MPRLLSFLSAFSLLALSAQQNVDSYVQSETPIAKAGVLANIGPNGSMSSGAAAGIVIASPSTTNPDYLFTWTRDSSLVFKALIDQYVSGQDTSLLGQIDNFITAEANLQQVSNPSGTITTGGLGEPKFNIDGSAFTGPWGRSRDGPALRATAMITFANHLLSQDNTTFVTQTLWPVIQNDLDYVQNNWNQTTFDLWEELDSSSFFTSAVQHRALREGSALATAIGQSGTVTGFDTQAEKVLCFLQSYWNPSGSYITANTAGGRVGIDANTILASIHTYDVDAGCDATTFQPCSDRALANHLVYVDSFRGIYNINSGFGPGVAAATGRYPEDVYQGGNPWYLATFAAAEQLYLALHTWSITGSIVVTSVSQPFFAQFDPSIAPGTYPASSSTYASLTSDISAYADGFVALNAKFTPSGGGLAEQFSKSDGTPVSAVDLTWSYASALTAFQARAGTVSASWGAKGLTVPSTCSTSGSGSAPTVAITFTVDATTVLGENIYITGSVDALQNWNTNTALILSPNDYPIWSITVNVPANTALQYKYIRKDGSGDVTWESDPNNSITTPGSGSTATQDTWR